MGALGPHVVGVRVVLRHVVRGETGPSGGPALTDVLGVCESWDDGPGGRVVVRCEDGTRVEVDRRDLVAGKPVPPRPPVHRRLAAEDADRAVVPGWPPHETAPLGDWLLRASGGFSQRGNSVLALGDPGVALDEAVARTRAWYADRSLRARAQVLPGSPAATALEDAGWGRNDPTVLALASVPRVLRRLPDEQHEVDLRERLDEAWLATDDRARRLGESARRVLEGGEAVTFATVRDGDRVLARGRGTVHGDWVGLSSLWTDPERRGRSLGTDVLRALLDRGASLGARTAYLQVTVANERARALYERLGFEEHHRYEYRVAPED